jgi:hypothetical protein
MRLLRFGTRFGARFVFRRRIVVPRFNAGFRPRLRPLAVLDPGRRLRLRLLASRFDSRFRTRRRAGRRVISR